MIINHNITALNTHSKLSSASAAQSKSMEKLASGLRINRAGDDAAGLAISEKMRAQVRGLDQASRNSQDGISLIQTAEGALNETHDILQRVRELADQSANGTNTADDRKALQDEVKQLKEEIDRIGNTTEFNTQKLLNGNLKSSGAAVGQNSTVGATVAKLSAGNISGTVTNAADANFIKETINIDGTNIDVNWQNLTADEKNVLKAAATDASSKQKAAELIGNKINEAIDASGKNVAHVNAYSDGTKLVVESGSKGVDSKVSATGTGVLKVMTAGAAGAEVAGTTKYSGTTVASGDKFNVEINGVTMEVVASADYLNDDPMATIASTMQTDINTAIGNANTAAGATNSSDPGYIANVKVNVTKEGKFEVLSESGPINFSDKAGKTSVLDLGLSAAQTDASSNGGMTFQIGANKGQTITFGVNDMRSAALGISGVDVSSQSGAASALTSIDSAIKNVSSERSKLGAVQNRLEHTINNLKTSSENITAAESRVRDVDMAKEMMNQTKNSILAQAAQAMLAQANQQPQGVLQLLR